MVTPERANEKHIFYVNLDMADKYFDKRGDDQSYKLLRELLSPKYNFEQKSELILKLESRYLKYSDFDKLLDLLDSCFKQVHNLNKKSNI